MGGLAPEELVALCTVGVAALGLAGKALVNSRRTRRDMPAILANGDSNGNPGTRAVLDAVTALHGTVNGIMQRLDHCSATHEASEQRRDRVMRTLDRRVAALEAAGQNGRPS